MLKAYSKLCRSFGKASKSIWEGIKTVWGVPRKNGLASFSKITAELRFSLKMTPF